MQYKALISSRETIRYSGLSSQLPVCDLKRIGLAEFTEWDEYLGWRLRECLESDLADYSNIGEWNGTASFLVGQVCKFNGEIYECIQDCTDVEPPHIEFWQPAPKFESDCLNDFWCNALAPYLAEAVALMEMPFLGTDITSEGFTVKTGRNFEQADPKVRAVVVASTAKMKEIAYRRLLKYVADNKANCPCLLKAKWLNVNYCQTCGETICGCEAKKPYYPDPYEVA